MRDFEARRQEMVNTQIVRRGVRRTGRGLVREDLGAVRFVPLIGEQGWGPETYPFGL